MNDAKVAWILSVTEGLSPRQRLIAGALAEMGWSVRVLGWNRNHPRTRAWDQGPWPVEQVCLKARVGSLSLLRVVPRYLRQVVEVLDRNQAGVAPAQRLVVATHLFHLFLLRRVQALWLYDAAEYFTYQLSTYFGPFSRIFEPLLARVELRLARGLTGIIAADSRNGWLERRYRGKGQRVHVLWNVPALGDDPTPAEIAACRSSYEGRCVIAYAGGISRRKGLDVMLAAHRLVYARRSDALLLLIGPLEHDAAALKKIIRELGIGDAVRMAGVMPYRSMLAHLAHSEVGLALYQSTRGFALTGAGNGRKLFTYMQAGLPIIASNHYDIARSVRDADCGVLVDPGNADAVADKILSLLEDSPRRQRLGQNGRQAFATRWNFEQEGAGLRSWLNQLLSAAVQ